MSFVFDSRTAEPGMKAEGIHSQHCYLRVKWFTSNLDVNGPDALCRLWSEHVIGPYFFESDEDVAQSVSSDRYSHMIIILLARDEMKISVLKICDFNRTVRQDAKHGPRESYWTRNCTFWWCKLVTKIVRFLTARLFLLSLPKVPSSCEQFSNSRFLPNEYPPSYGRGIARSSSVYNLK